MEIRSKELQNNDKGKYKERLSVYKLQFFCGCEFERAEQSLIREHSQATITITPIVSNNLPNS